MICDFHAHFIPEKIAQHTSFFKGVWTNKAMFFDFLSKNNIDFVHLVYPSTDAHLKISQKDIADIYNKAISLLFKEGQGKIVGSALIPFENDLDVGLFRQIKDLGFKSVSLSSSYNGDFQIPFFKKVLAQAVKEDLVVFVHPQIINPIGFDRVKDPLLMPVLEYSFDVSMCLGLCMMENVFKEIPDVKIVFSSLAGSIPLFKDRFDGVYNMLRNRNMVKDLGLLPSEIMKKAYVDLSGIRSEIVLKLALDFFDSDHILFASDYPANMDINSQINALNSLSDQLRDKILFKNFLKIFNLE